MHLESNQFEKPYIDVDINNPIGADEVVAWIIDNDIEVLNVAGNRESTCRGIGKFTFEYFSDVYGALDTHGSNEKECER